MVLSWLRAGALIDRFTQGLAGLEVRHALLRDGHGLAGAWVAAHARRAVGHGKTAETPDFDALSEIVWWYMSATYGRYVLVFRRLFLSRLDDCPCRK